MQALSSLPPRTVTVLEPVERQYRLLWFVALDPDAGERSGAGMRFINFARELTRSGVLVHFAVNCWPGQDVQKMQEYLSNLKEQNVIAGSYILRYRYPHRLGTLGALALHPGLTNVVLKSVRAPAVDSIRDFIEANGINLFINSDRMLFFLGPALMDRVPVICDWTDSLVLYYSRALVARIRSGQIKGFISFFRDFQANLIAEAYYGRRSTFNLLVSPVDKKWMDRTNFSASRKSTDPERSETPGSLPGYKNTKKTYIFRRDGLRAEL